MTKIRDEVLDELLAGYQGPEDLLGPGGLLKRLTGALVERAIGAELTEHLGYEKHAAGGRGTGNSRNGTTPKTLRTEQGDVEIAVPRDRAGTFEPQLVQKHQTHFDGFDEKIISMYARGMTVRDIQQHLAEIYSTEVSADFISKVTDAVVDELSTWQSRPLEAVWPIVYLDAIVLKVRDQGAVRNKAVYLAIGVRVDGCKEVLGMWIAETEGAKFWLHVVTELKNRGVDDILIVCCDGLKGFPDAIEAVFPRAIVQTCVVHMIRNSLRYVSWKERKTVALDLRTVYSAPTVEAAEAALTAFEQRWRPQYPTIAQSWRANWERVIPFLEFSKDLRRILYTTNAIESFNAQLRKVTRNRGHFPNDDAAKKLLYLALKNAAGRWAAPQHYWSQALLQLTIRFEDRLPA